MKWIDPIVQEVRTTREKLWKECNYDLSKLCRKLRKNQTSHSSQVVTKTKLSGEILMSDIESRI